MAAIVTGHQCAWCGRQEAEDGHYVGIRLPREAAELVARIYARYGVSHGICPTCKAELERRPERAA